MKHFWIAVLSCVSVQMALADNYFLERRQNRLVEQKVVFQESEWTLPNVPDVNQGDWFNLPMPAYFRGEPSVLLSSIETAEDGSIRYLLNNRSAAHYDNISAEAILCTNETSSFASDGAKFKTFGFADMVNQRWIQPRKSDWRILGGVHNSNDPVRNVLFQAFCLNTKAKNDDELRLRVKAQAKPNYYH